MKKSAKNNSGGIHIHLTNRWLYTLVALVVLVVAAIGVYALTPGVAPNPGHLISEVAPPSPCSGGQYLEFDGTNWVCNTPSSGLSTPPSCTGSNFLQWTGTTWACGSDSDGYAFGGAYVRDNYGVCGVANPYTSGCSCPGGYSTVGVATDSYGDGTFICA